MAAKSDIEWTESTWNPLTGCTKISPGCKNCYAERMAKRLQGMGNPNYQDGFQLSLHPHLLNLPLEWKRSQMVFVNSMSDMFHPDVPWLFIKQLFGVMRKASWHQFQVLTKRSDRLKELGEKISWPDNVWMGVSIENQDFAFRADHLRATKAKVKFLSLEPLLGALPDLNLLDIDWVIVGGESGPNSRSMEKNWVLEIRDQCQKAEVAFFFKQWGGFSKKQGGRTLEGRTWDELPQPKVLDLPLFQAGS